MIIASTNRDTRQETKIFITHRANFATPRPTTNHHPNHAKPAIAMAIFATHTMLIGR